MLQDAERVAVAVSFLLNDGSEFQELLDNITNHISRHYTRVMLNDVRAEFWDMVGQNLRVA